MAADTIIIDSLQLVKQIIVQPSITDLKEKVYWGMSEGLAIILIPSLISILIFILTQAFLFVNRKFIIVRETNNYKKVIFCWIDQIENLVKTQVESCRSFAINLQQSNNITPIRFVYVKMLAEKIDEINIEKIINIFITNTSETKTNGESHKMTFSIIAQFNYLKSVENVLKITYESHQKQIIEIMNEWNKHFENLNKLSIEISKEIRGDKTHEFYDFNQRIMNISEQWIIQSQGGKSTNKNSVQNLVTPLSNFVDEVINSDTNNKYAYELSGVLQELRLVNYKWEKNIEGFSSIFSLLAENIEKSYEDLILAKRFFLSETKTKHFIFI
jgi:hypothetical protein